MMKIFFFMIMLIFLSFQLNFWLIQCMMFMLMFMCLFNFCYSGVGELSLIFGHDLLSYILILLSIWISSLMVMSSEKIYKFNIFSYFFIFNLVFLLFSLLLVFSSLNFFIFYLFFELSLIPTLILILGWGYQPERIEAGIYLLFYTLLMSLPMMIMIFYIYFNYGSLFFYLMNLNLKSLFMYLCLNLIFFVKIPMFFIHLWLPKAHVEAPISGSMILAGIMLKLGGYGLLRTMSFFSYVKYLNLLFIIISLFGGVVTSLICIRQSDMKSLIAYSSIAHMGLVLAGVMTLTKFGILGSILLMVAHGLCSSGLFCLINIFFERTMSRSIYLNKGLLSMIPSLSLWAFLLSISNMASPPSLNLFGEIFLINSLVFYNGFNLLFLCLISFLSAAYSLFLYSFTQHGKFYSSIYIIYSGLSREYLLLLLHWLPLNLLFMNLDFLG